MGVARPENRFRIDPHSIALGARTPATRGPGARSTALSQAAGGAGDSPSPNGEGGLGVPSDLICERVARLLGTIDAAPPQPRLPRTSAATGPVSQRRSATRRRPAAAEAAAAEQATREAARPERATKVSPCWRCRARHEHAPSRASIHGLLEAVIRRDVLPILRARHPDCPSPLGRAAEQLADSLQAASFRLDAMIAAIEPILRPFGWSASARAPIFEQAARLLGDRFARDTCDDGVITMALVTLQAALDGAEQSAGGLADGSHSAASDANGAPTVLVVTAPGECHHLGTVLARKCLGEWAWVVGSAAPADDAALEDLVADDWLDVLHIAQSCVFRRDHWQARLARTIAAARAASRNPGLVISVGGRLFSEDGDAWVTVGADAGSTSAATLRRSIETARRRRRQG